MAAITVTVVHFTDYHSHAVPSFSEHAPGQGGIARTLAYLHKVRTQNPNTLLLSGGDMINAGSPAWSDKYGCVEWRWLSGLVDAMALGNHDVDQGWAAFQACRAAAAFPVLSGNLEDGAGHLLLSAGGRPYVIKTFAGGVRVGVFALSGGDFAGLIRPENLPAGARFSDATVAARSIVARLRQQERVDAVVFLGHQDRDSDLAMARAVPGIDLILGSHSHLKNDFMMVPGTQTAFISPYQYLHYLSRVELRFDEPRSAALRAIDGHKLSGMRGELVKMDASLPEDPVVKAKVEAMEAALERDPVYAARFQVIGQAAVELSNQNITMGESLLGDVVMDVVRAAARGQVALSTASSFRAPIPPGPVRLEDYLTALPYKNQILVFRMSGAQVQALLDLSASKRGSDLFAVTSGVRYRIAGGKAVDVRVGSVALDAAARYDVVTTDYLAHRVAGYRDLFAAAGPARDTGLIVNDTVIGYIKTHSPVSAALDGRVTP